MFVVTGTDTGIGKTVCAALLTLGLRGTYWKPVQSGLDDGTDTQTVKTLTGLPEHHFIAELYRLNAPLSPHRAAELDDIIIDVDRLVIPQTVVHKPLIIEGAGGLMVPVTRQMMMIDLFQRWNVPVILCARTGLGTINHTLLSIEALRRRNMSVHGLVFIGADNPDNMKTIADFSGCTVLGHIPPLETINSETLSAVFSQRFRITDFA